MRTDPSLRFAERERSLLYVAYSGWSSLRTISIGGAGAGWGSYLLWTNPRVAAFIFIVPLGLLGLVYVATGIAALRRRGPILTADEQGVVASVGGIGIAQIDWDDLVGAAVVGRGSMQALALVLRDEQAAAAVSYPGTKGLFQRLRNKHGLPAAFYVLARYMAEPPEPIAERLDALIRERSLPIDHEPTQRDSVGQDADRVTR
ncbi:MAG: hypothetical protein H7Y88_04150 [Phycisphaerales bacterium]|nr:hypothetical protein [Phycisphaerales bacterium]